MKIDELKFLEGKDHVFIYIPDPFGMLINSWSWVVQLPPMENISSLGEGEDSVSKWASRPEVAPAICPREDPHGHTQWQFKRATL